MLKKIELLLRVYNNTITTVVNGAIAIWVLLHPDDIGTWVGKFLLNIKLIVNNL